MCAALGFVWELEESELRSSHLHGKQFTSSPPSPHILLTDFVIHYIQRPNFSLSTNSRSVFLGRLRFLVYGLTVALKCSPSTSDTLLSCAHYPELLPYMTAQALGIREDMVGSSKHPALLPACSSCENETTSKCIFPSRVKEDAFCKMYTYKYNNISHIKIRPLFSSLI